MSSDYKNFIKYLNSLQLFGVKLGLDNISTLLERLGNPQNDYKTIHIAGTNGKGSVTSFCSSILSEAGHRTGMYTSPHLISLTERIRVNNVEITKEVLLSLGESIKKEVEQLKKEGIQITYFEFLTALAFLYFQQQEVEIAVIEVGLGGRLDATNVINPEVSIITNIAKDHTHILGDDLLSIAKEKAGIIKENGILVTIEKNGDILNLFKNICREKNSDFVDVSSYDIRVMSSNIDGQELLVKSKMDKYDIKTTLFGEHQKDNILAAIMAVEALQIQGGPEEIQVPKSSLVKGIFKAKWPGRLEVLQENPLVLLDCAHNPAGMKELVRSLKVFNYHKLILVLGTSDKKDYKEMVRLIHPMIDEVIITKAKYRGMDAKVLAREIESHGTDAKNLQIIENVVSATNKAMENAGENDLVLIAGSIFMAGEARKVFRNS